MRSSIVKKLYVNLIISIFILWIAVIASIAWVVKGETDEIFDSSLQEVSQILLSLAALEIKSKNDDISTQLSKPSDHDEYLTYQIFNSNGAILIRSHNAPEKKFPIPLKVGYYIFNDQYFFVESNIDQTLYIAVAEQKGHRSRTFTSLLEYLLWPLIALFPLSALAIYLSVKSARQSIQSIVTDISTRSDKNLNPIDTNALKIEFLGLGESVNALMHRLKIAFNAERNFATNSAHELRTPIAAALAQLDVLKLEISESGAKNKVTEAKLNLKKLQSIVVKLLQLARADSGLLHKSEKIDLSSLLRMLIRDMSFISARRVNLDLPEVNIFIYGNIDAIGIVMQNILENADSHAFSDTPINVKLLINGECIIDNDCSPIPDLKLKNLTSRFVRLNKEREGLGIGLSIVSTFLTQAGTPFLIKSPCYENNRGFSFHILFSTNIE